jgi:FtsP/CotA-like multicopper oxidase with cupredoxin domain
MRETMAKKTFWQLTLGLIAFMMVWTATSFAVEFNMRADTTTVTMLDGTTIVMWGFALEQPAGDGIVKIPGPILEVPSGDSTLTIRLTNNLPVPVSIVIPGQSDPLNPTWIDPDTGAVVSTGSRPAGNYTARVRSLTTETSGLGGVGTYTWNNFRPGTYLYHSGTQSQVQVQMGLYGGLKKNAGAGVAYAGVPFDNEVILFYSEIDPGLHAAVAGGTYGTAPYTSTLNYVPKYFLVNGQPFPQASPIVDHPISPNERVLIRFLNAGLKTHVPTLQGTNDMSVVAEDGNLLPYPKQQYSVLLPAGKTQDAILQPSAATYAPIYDRMLALTSGGVSPGGMMLHLKVLSPTQYTLTIDKGGTGTGAVTVSSLPFGIDCGLDCVETYNPDTTLALLAAPSPDSFFINWSGGLKSAANPGVATMDGTKGVTAIFMNTPPGAATLISPAEAITDTTPTYTWNGVLGATDYYLWVNDSTGAKVQQRYTAAEAGCIDYLDTCSATPAIQLAGGAATWWIQARNPLGDGPWNTGMSFTLLPPAATTLVSPTGEITDPTPTYTWNAVLDSTWYRLWVNDVSGNRVQTWYAAADAGCPDGTGTCSVTPTMEVVGASQWWVQTYSNAGFGSWSTPLSFTAPIPTVPSAATLVSPTGAIADTTPAYTWNAVSGATWYQLWVNDSSGNRIQTWYAAADAGCPDGTGTCSVTPTTEAVGPCQWWVQTYNRAGFGPWSTPLSFTAPIPTVPSAATLVSPTGAIADTTPTYTWDAVSDATWYHLWVNDSTGNKINQWYAATVAGCPDGTGTCSVTPTTAVMGASQWWIQTYNAAGYGLWSAPMDFTVP